MERAFLVLLFSLVTTISLTAQTDTKFWFAAPEVTKEHGDSPVYLRLSAYDQEADVTISIPSRGASFNIRKVIPANSSVTIDLTSRLHLLEPSSYNKVLRSGLLITSSAEISAFYEVAGFSSFFGGITNTDIFTLKGYYALGTSFLTPFQNYWANESQNLRNAYSSFCIVATEDNTTVKVIPSTNLLGHPKGEEFTVVLNKGQTYSCRAKEKEAQDHPSGTEITSDKPIAVTISDDSVVEDGSYDLIGDQLVPVTHLGKEYIFPFIGEEETEKGFICATQDNTDVYLNNESTPYTTLSKGSTIKIPVNSPGTYVRSNKPLYALHVVSDSSELAGALLPGIQCTGSKSVGFSHPGYNDLVLLVVAPAGSEESFTFNGDPNVITKEDFKTIEVADDKQYVILKKKISEEYFTTDSTYRIDNPDYDFHLGIVSNDLNVSYQYGYFSSFGRLDLGPDVSFCPGGAVVLDAGGGKENYKWNTGDISNQILVADSGEYWVTATKGECTLSDTVQVSHYPVPDLSLGQDIYFCDNEERFLSPKSDYPYYSWNTGSREKTIKIEKSGIYSLSIKNIYGCSNSDSINATIYTSPSPAIYFPKSDYLLCKEETIEVKTESNYKSYNWHNRDSLYYTNAPTNSTYSVTVTDHNNCQGYVERTLDCSPFIKVFNLLTPNGDGLNDNFYIEGMHNQMYTLEVYNRWGNKVYSNKAYNNNWFPDKEISNGVYYYILTHNEGKATKKGWLHITQ